MLTRVVCPTTPGARSLQTRAAACSALRPTNASLLKAGRHQQIRSFRFGIWSSYLDPEFQRELRHRHRMIKHKYADALNRRLSWEQRPLDQHPKAILKHMLRRYWNPAQVRCGTRFVNHDELSGRQQQTRHVSDTEDRRMKMKWSPNPWMDHWKSQLDQAMNHWTEQAQKGTGQTEHDPHPTRESATAETKFSKKLDEDVDTSSASDYVIDPITNRKVPRITIDQTEDMVSPQPDSFKAYRAQFATFTPPNVQASPGPIHSNGPPPPAELKEYGQINIDQEPPRAVDGEGHGGSSALADSTEPYRDPIIQSEDYALNHLPPEESDQQYGDLHRYQAYQHNEIPEQVPELTEKYEDLGEYKTYGAREAKPPNPEVSRDFSELHEYKPYIDDESASVGNQTIQHDDLGQYGPYKYQEDVKKDEAAPKYEDLDKYKHFNDDNGKPVDDLAPKYEDLNKYDGANFQDSVGDEQPFQQYGDLENYRAFRHQELDDKTTLERDIVAESLKEFEAKEQESIAAENARPSTADRLRKLDLDAASPLISDSTSTVPSFHLSIQPSNTKAESWDDLERSMASRNEASDAADREASSNVRESRTRVHDEGSHSSQRQLTGNYVRDFPEEFSGSWSSKASRLSFEPSVESESETPNEKSAYVQAAEKQYSDQLSNSVNFAKLETSLDRQQTQPKPEPVLNQGDAGPATNTASHQPIVQAEVDPYSKEPQGLETSYTKECDGTISSSTFAKTYSGEPGEANSESPSIKGDTSQGVLSIKSTYYRDPEIDGRLPISTLKSDSMVEPSQTTEPMVYKILAYDPTMQKINIAETTSVVPDQAAPLTPTEVLLRLSNPTKFFPHFAPLQAEGFEIVSGGGDVLVFRQIRPGKTASKATAAPVNPIDMMGKPPALPNAAAFVSPTGFVNYDMPNVEEETRAPPFRSNIDVRREEPVFSGRKSPTYEEAQSRKKKRSIGRRALIGGVWVAGISYAIGVVSEYFLTGGADGRGPTGF
ncbi:hypothetical protein F4677DRAFT_409290 [Hypoxylon crocopeplum]|nr:hypothetical protein F4677DRAFT_409290 [Hypoxylon crocopeplum]